MSKQQSTPQTFLDLFLKDVRKFLPMFDKGLEAYFLKCKGKPGQSGVSLHQYLKWLSPSAKPPENASKLSIVISGYLHYFWQFSKPNFVFEPLLSSHMADSQVPETIPAEILQRLPYWCQWITLPIHLAGAKMQLDFDGAFVGYTKIENRPALILVAPFISSDDNLSTNGFTPSVTTYVYLDEPVNHLSFVRNSHLLNVSDQMPDTILQELMFSTYHYITKIVCCIMYICSQQEALHTEGHSQPKPQRMGKSYRITPPKTDRAIRVGAEMTKILKDFEDEVEACTRAFNGRRPHIRKAHHHHFWTGPKAGPRKLISKWLPPQIVRGTNVE